MNKEKSHPLFWGFLGSHRVDQFGVRIRRPLILLILRTFFIVFKSNTQSEIRKMCNSYFLFPATCFLFNHVPLTIMVE
jgi:hypothetical protein